MAVIQLAIALATILFVTILLAVYRLQTILDPKRPKPVRHGRRHPNEPTHLLIVLGSGGHTAEMIAMLERAVNEMDETRRLKWKNYTYRTWVVGAGDGISAQRAKEFEDMASGLVSRKAAVNSNINKDRNTVQGGYEIVGVPRARNIHQSVFTAPLSCLRCMLACAAVLLSSPEKWRDRDFPDLALCNGPATATILIFTSILLRFFDVRGCNSRGKMRTIYVESWARVKKLSLSGKFLERVVDRFLVQWPQLTSRSNGRAEYLGILV